MKKLLWLDDYRDPFNDFKDWVNLYSPIGPDVEVHWVKDWEEFTLWLFDNGLPDAVCFDHDLADEHYTPEVYWDDYEASKAYQEAQNHKEKTGLDCALFLTQYCDNNSLPLPLWVSHSANPVGRDNINRLLTNYMRQQLSSL